MVFPNIGARLCRHCDGDATSTVDLLTGFIDSLSFHLSFSQVMFFTPAIHSLCCSFLIFSSRQHKVSVPLQVITRSKISFHVHASNVDHAITCGKGSFHAITSNKSANHASRQIAWGVTQHFFDERHELKSRGKYLIVK